MRYARADAITLIRLCHYAAERTPCHTRRRHYRRHALRLFCHTLFYYAIHATLRRYAIYARFLPMLMLLMLLRCVLRQRMPPLYAVAAIFTSRRRSR